MTDHAYIAAMAFGFGFGLGFGAMVATLIATLIAEGVKRVRDSDGTASAALCEDIAVPKNCQARPSPNPSHRPIRRENNG